MEIVKAKLNINSLFCGYNLVKCFAVISYAYIIKKVEVIKNAANQNIFSLKDLCFNCSLSALKHLSLSITNWRSRLNHVGRFQYVKIIPIQATALRKSILVRNESIKKIMIATPDTPDKSITFRSLLKKFDMRFFYNKFCKYIRSISHKLIKLCLILPLSLIFCSNLSFAVAQNECLSAINKYEKIYKIPTGLLKAISKVESEFNPLALNDGLKQHNFKSKDEVLERISYLKEIGKTNFDIGCMQVNYYWHGNNFTSVNAMLDVTENVRYAASLIHGLYKTHGNWQAAVRHYHSNDPKFHKLYSKKIALAWLKEETSNELF